MRDPKTCTAIVYPEFFLVYLLTIATAVGSLWGIVRLKAGPVEFLFSKTFERFLGLRELPIQLVTFAASSGVGQELALYHSPAFISEVKGDWGYASTFSCAFMACTDADFFSCTKYEGISWWTVLPVWLTSLHPRDQNRVFPSGHISPTFARQGRRWYFT